MRSFEKYQSLNTNLFEVVERDKQYNKYLQRIENIVNRKPRQDNSQTPTKTLKSSKEAGGRRTTNDSESKIKNENHHLFNKILATKNRRLHYSEHSTIDMSGPRRREVEKINMQNMAIGMRLSRLYEKKPKHNEVEIIRHTSQKSLYIKDRKLPLLFTVNQHQKPSQNT